MLCAKAAGAVAVLLVNTERAAQFAENADFCVETFILDAYDPGQAGGTGKRVDWQIAAKAAKLGRVILAGGLNPENVTEAIKIVNPYGVDISSGIEISPGQKDHGKMRKFITEVKRQSCD